MPVDEPGELLPSIGQGEEEDLPELEEDAGRGKMKESVTGHPAFQHF